MGTTLIQYFFKKNFGMFFSGIFMQKIVRLTNLSSQKNLHWQSRSVDDGPSKYLLLPFGSNPTYIVITFVTDPMKRFLIHGNVNFTNGEIIVQFFLGPNFTGSVISKLNHEKHWNKNNQNTYQRLRATEEMEYGQMDKWNSLLNNYAVTWSLKGMVHWTWDMASDDDVGPPE